VGGVLCLDFVNTVDDRLDQQPVDFLSSYPALIAWCRHAGAVDAEEAARLNQLARGGGEVALTRVREIREALYGVLRALAERAPVPAADLATVNRALAGLLGPPALRAWDSGVRAEAAGEAGLDLDTPQRRVLRSVIELLGHGRADLLRKCAAPDCSFLFLDRTKSQNRLWCRSGGCGTRNRFRRYYARHRNQSEL
jgi:predicted RNA-binding Zn ribbon-like protein